MARSQGQTTVSLSAGPNQSNPVDCDHLAAIRKAVSDEGWGVDALGSFMRRDKSLISRTLNGERPTLHAAAFILDLPLGVQRRLAATWARHLGLVVVEPDIDQETAARHVLGGLVFLLTSLSVSQEAVVHVIRGLAWWFGGARPKKMAKAELRAAEKRDTA